ncbi:MAG: hypothetical protein AB8G11_13530 [Saprospiraceae bacterium]
MNQKFIDSLKKIVVFDENYKKMKSVMMVQQFSILKIKALYDSMWFTVAAALAAV